MAANSGSRSLRASLMLPAKKLVLSSDRLTSLVRRGRMRRRLAQDAFNQPETLQSSSLVAGTWWYYAIELLPGVITKGHYPPDLPMLPRLMLRRCQLRGMTCLDLGSMEGMIPVLMCRGGAKEVLATDFADHCGAKMEAVKHYYDVDFGYKSVGLMYDLYKKLSRRSFDLINCSGLLYHVFPPMSVLAGVRPLLKRNGLMIVSTNVVLDDRYIMEFNNSGRMQEESNTFWYASVPLLDYLLRYFRLTPVDMLFWRHADARSDIRYTFDRPSAYLSVLCRASDHASEDKWMEESVRLSWEYQGLSDWNLAARQPHSSIQIKGNVSGSRIDLWEAINTRDPVPAVTVERDTHTLRLSAFE